MNVCSRRQVQQKSGCFTQASATENIYFADYNTKKYIFCWLKFDAEEEAMPEQNKSATTRMCGTQASSTGKWVRNRNIKQNS